MGFRLQDFIKLQPYVYHLTSRDNLRQHCAYNSVSPRVANKKRSPRGSKAFVTAEEFPKGRRDVVEVTFENFVLLPHETEVRFSTVTAWRPIPEEAADADK